MSLREYLYKIVLIGDGGVGKTTIRKSFAGVEFNERYQMTIGVDFAMAKITLPDPENPDEAIKISLQLWDLGGQPHFNQVRKTFYMGSSGALLVFDVTDIDTMYNLENWFHELENGAGKIPVIMVGNKIDLRDLEKKGHVDFETALQFNEKLSKIYGMKIPLVETSGKTGENVETAFLMLSHYILHKKAPSFEAFVIEKK
ncbi:MAG: GTP-binding protein [Candidatus Odinarchaeota archaeon]|nr:GTP-binding protein [Candidatus Odinarchaeota archaeon]